MLSELRSTLLRAGRARLYSESTRGPAKNAVKDAAGAFKKDGAVGKEFTAEGSIGGTAQAVGGPFDKEGSIGKNFNPDGAIGGKAQQAGEEGEKSAKNPK